MEDSKYVELLRDSFKKLIQNLVIDTDFEVMYEELNDSDIGKSRMSSVFVLRADSDSSNERLSKELYDGIVNESNKDFLLWIEAIRSALRRTGNTKNGKHAVVEETISDLIKKTSETKRGEVKNHRKTYKKTESEKMSELQLSCEVSGFS